MAFPVRRYFAKGVIIRQFGSEPSPTAKIRRAFSPPDLF
jgi:hypothetical protein